MADFERLGRYRIGERIGAGGMAEVYRGDIEGAVGFSRPVAIKLVRADLVDLKEIGDAFLAEAEIARGLHHGNIVQIFDLGVEAGRPYLVLEYVDGVCLEEVRGALGRDDALFVVEQVAAALEHAHELGVVHRDVKPRNILLSCDGVVKLADFGIAKAKHIPSRTLPGFVKGTLGYLAPEQVRGGAVDGKADQFATGVVLFELLARGNPLAEAEDIDEYAEFLARGLPPLELDGDDGALAAIVARATASAPAERYPSMGELRSALESWRVHHGVRSSPAGVRHAVRTARGEGGDRGGRLDEALAMALPPARETPAREPTVRATRTWLLAGVGAFLGLALAGLVVALWSNPSHPATADASRMRAEPQPQPEDTAQADGAAGDADAGPAGAAPARDAGARQADDTSPPGSRPRVAAGRGRLKVNLIPYAEVTVDGKAHGRTPVSLMLRAGVHRVELHNPDTGQRRTLTVEVTAGKTRSIIDWQP